MRIALRVGQHKGQQTNNFTINLTHTRHSDRHFSAPVSLRSDDRQDALAARRA